MLSRFDDLDRTFGLFDEFRRRMDRIWDEYEDRYGGADGSPSSPRALAAPHAPRVNVLDAGANLVVQADVPGMTDKDIEITLHDGVLSLRGERKTDVPEGYAAHRRERSTFRFARSLTLPVKVDHEKTTAQVKNGVLTVTLAKSAESKPRQITVRAQA